MISLGAFLLIPPRTPQGVICSKKRQTMKWGGANRQSIGRQHRYNLWEWVASHAKYLKLEQNSCQVARLFPHFTSQFPHFCLFSPHWEFPYSPSSSSSNLLKRKKNIHRKRTKKGKTVPTLFPHWLIFNPQVTTTKTLKSVGKCGAYFFIFQRVTSRKVQIHASTGLYAPGVSFLWA